MRTTFIETLSELAEHDERIHLVVGDLGFGVVEGFAHRFPDRFVNVGVAEQLLIGLSAGIALTGGVVFAYSIANFPTLRALEQIRNDVCYHDLDVIVVAVGGGLSYGALGSTHHATEDIAMLRALPAMTVVAPGDPFEVRESVGAMVGHGPCYLRLGRSGEPTVPRETDSPFRLGEASVVRRGARATLVSTGAMLADTVAAADLLAADGIDATVLSMHTVSPLDRGAVLAAASATGVVCTVEEHSVTGGLGSAVAEVLAEAGLPAVAFGRVGLPRAFVREVGSQEYLKARLGLDAPGIATAVRHLLATGRAGHRDEAEAMWTTA